VFDLLLTMILHNLMILLVINNQQTFRQQYDCVALAIALPGT
jgi:hypothetical protein